MRIDLNHGPQVGEAGPSPSQPLATRSAVSRQADGEDHAELSAAGAQVQALASRASQLPEIRTERVQSLRQAILGGSYHVNPEQVAGAMLEHMMAGNVA